MNETTPVPMPHELRTAANEYLGALKELRSTVERLSQTQDLIVKQMRSVVEGLEEIVYKVNRN